MYIRAKGEMYEVRSGWRIKTPHSAWAEPLAASEIIAWARARWGGDANVALISDHSAMATGQRRWWSGNGGFSTAYHLNLFFSTLYGGGERNDVWYVEGPKNIADGVSRMNNIGDPLRFQRVDKVLFPSLQTFYHPFVDKPTRPWWNV